tara:strand:- start:966 stop:1841 length:876 start_codon:yes stop_codon:yes gene_type:complete
MDEVLTRKMFKARYFKSLKPTIKHYQTGGLSSLTPQEKAIYASTLAAPLLQAKGSGVGNALTALGEGVGKLPATILSIEKMKAEKNKPKKSIRSATASEKEDLGYNRADRLIVNVEGDRVTGIADKPTAGEREKAADRSATLKQADKILKYTEQIDTGPIAGRYAKVKAALNLDPRAAQFNVTIEEFKKSAIKALRGAQVGPLEEASFNALLPAITDNDDNIRAKVNVMKEKLLEIDRRLGSDGTVTDPGNLSSYADAFQKFGINVNVEELSYDSKLDMYDFTGDNLVLVD